MSSNILPLIIKSLMWPRCKFFARHYRVINQLRLFFQPFEQIGVLIFISFSAVFVAEARLKLFFEFLYLRVQEALISSPTN